MHIPEISLDPRTFASIGVGLLRPESVICGPDGIVYACDARGGYVSIGTDGQAAVGAGTLVGSLPNGLSLGPQGEIYMADFWLGAVYEVSAAGEFKPVLTEIDGAPLGAVNHVHRDEAGRLWVSVSTRNTNWVASINNHTADGYVILIDDKGARIVADGLMFPNETRVDRGGKYLYVAETTGKRVRRFQIQPDGSLDGGAVFGPSSLGAGLTEGLAFDSDDNLWVVMTCSDRLVVLSPEGEATEILADQMPDKTEELERVFASGDDVPLDLMFSCGSEFTNLLTSVAFGGPGAGTVYLGSLRGFSVLTFQSPLAAG